MYETMTNPPRRSAAVTLDATLSGVRGIFVGVGGNIALVHRGNSGTAVLHKNVPSGSYIPGEVVMVASASTTATDIVAWY